MLQFTDWLGLSLRLSQDPVAAPAGFVWQQYTGTNVWEHRQILYTTEGLKVCTLLWKPKSSIISCQAALLEIENEWLYHGVGADGILDTLITSCNFYVSGISRLDLCVDFNPNNDQTAVIEALARGDCYVQGKRNGSSFWSVAPPIPIRENYPSQHTFEKAMRRCSSRYLHPHWLGGKIPHCQSWGHKTSSVKWKLYYKTKELIDAGNGICFDKPYIVDKWRLGGLDTSNVWRLEVSLTNCNQFDYRGQRITYDCYMEHEADIFTAFYNQRFTIRRNEGHIDKTNDTIVPLLPIGRGFKGVRHNAGVAVDERNPRITLLRHLVKDLDEPAVLMDDTTRENTLWLIQQMVERDNLHNYFHMMCDMNVYEYIEYQRVTAGDMLSPPHPPKGLHGRQSVSCL